MKVEVIKQFSVFLPNRPGALSLLMKIFSEEKINIVGIASEVRDDSGVVRVAVGEDKDVSSILTKHGFSSVESRLLSIEAPDRPGELFQIARCLADSRINITTVYGSAQDGRASRLLFAVENTEKARALIEKIAG
ncbi:MAG: ACT domain-containing protein [Elusimicrobia bacterium]|nr:ACT domain-containing protein [Elusimicrobiota bacterium]